MRNTTNLPNSGWDYRRPAGPETKRPLRERPETGSSISAFLKEAVGDRFARERDGGSDFDDDLVRIGPLPELEDEKASDLRVLPAPDTAADPNMSTEIPTWKRALDVTVISLTWPFWFPLMILIMIAIKVTSAGPIFYRQERVGYRGRAFMIFKFRTMKVNVDTGVHESHFERLIATDSPMTKLDVHGDPRLIKWGRFLRAAGLDELPQIFNVLRGEMSLVGPRPCTQHEFKRYQPWQRARVNAPPGMTGYWQVNGKNKTTFSEMIEMDVFYGKNMSASLDLSIMLRTIPAIVAQVIESRGINLWRSRYKEPAVRICPDRSGA